MAVYFCAWDQATDEQTHNRVLLSDIVDLDYPEFDALYATIEREGSATIQHEGREVFIKLATSRGAYQPRLFPGAL